MDQWKEEETARFLRTFKSVVALWAVLSKLNVDSLAEKEKISFVHSSGIELLLSSIQEVQNEAHCRRNTSETDHGLVRDLWSILASFTGIAAFKTHFQRYRDAIIDLAAWCTDKGTFLFPFEAICSFSDCSVAFNVDALESMIHGVSTALEPNAPSFARDEAIKQLSLSCIRRFEQL